MDSLRNGSSPTSSNTLPFKQPEHFQESKVVTVDGPLTPNIDTGITSPNPITTNNSPSNNVTNCFANSSHVSNPSSGSGIDAMQNLVAAALAATVSTVAVQPLDVLRTRLQVRHIPKMYGSVGSPYSRTPSATPKPSFGSKIVSSLMHIGRTEGARGLYRGVLPSLFSVVPSISVYFTLYSQFKQTMGLPTGMARYDTAMQSMCAGSASFATSALTNPLWVVKARMQTSTASKSYKSCKDNSIPATNSQTATQSSAPQSTHKVSSSVIYENDKLSGGMTQNGNSKIGNVNNAVIARSYSNLHFTSPTTLSPRNIIAPLGPSPLVFRLSRQSGAASDLAICRRPLGTTASVPVANTSCCRSGTFQTLRHIVRTEGMRGLYRGLGASLITSSQAMIQFPLYEALKWRMSAATEDLLADDVRRVALSYLGASATAASVACVSTYPSEVVRSRMQVQGIYPHLPIKYRSVIGAFGTIFREEGVSGLYRGMGTSLIRLIPSHALSFTVYEFILRLMKDGTLYK